MLHQFGGAGYGEQAALREGHQLHVDEMRVAAAQRQHFLDVRQAEHRLHVPSRFSSASRWH